MPTRRGKRAGRFRVGALHLFRKRQGGAFLPEDRLGGFLPSPASFPSPTLETAVARLPCCLSQSGAAFGAQAFLGFSTQIRS
jgi:hypothetical protein